MEDIKHSPIAVLGAGSWGTALALNLSRRGQEVRVWSIDQTEIEAMLTTGKNERFLPGHVLPPSLKPMLDLATAVNGANDILLAIPSVGFRSTLALLKPLLTKHNRFICATKGLEEGTGRFCHEMLEEVLGSAYPFAALSGPSFAKEVASGAPTAVMVASGDAKFRQAVCQRFHDRIFQTFPCDDVVGVEVGAVLKNVIAIATGICDGLGLGTNSRSALITCGLQEITRLGLKLGAKAATFTSLAGLGDLILTCSDDQSRNRRLGLAIGKGKDIQAAEKEIGQIVEGKRNAEIVVLLASKHKVPMPICQLVHEVLQGQLTAKQALDRFLDMPRAFGV